MDPEELQSGAVEAPESDKRVSEPEHVADFVRQAFEQHKVTADAVEADDKSTKDRQRDDAGRFAAKPKEPEPKALEASPAAQQEIQTAANRPPVGWSPAAKAQFDRLPPEVQEAVARREAEVDKGFAILADYKGLDQFSPMLKAAGITHAEFARRAVEWEQNLKSKPADTAAHVMSLAAQNAGQHPAQFAAAMFRQVAQRVGLSPQQAIAMLQGQGPILAVPQSPRVPQPAALTPGAVRDMVDKEFASRAINSEVDAFLKDPQHPHAQTVFEDMASLIESGRAVTLKDAYDKACWLNDEIRTQLINQQRPAPAAASNVARAKAAAKAVTGAPGRAVASSPSKVGETVADAARAAYEAVRGAS